jgi:hypothetical protein
MLKQCEEYFLSNNFYTKRARGLGNYLIGNSDAWNIHIYPPYYFDKGSKEYTVSFDDVYGVGTMDKFKDESQIIELLNKLVKSANMDDYYKKFGMPNAWRGE